MSATDCFSPDDPHQPRSLDDCGVELDEEQEECGDCGFPAWDCRCRDVGGES